MDQGPLVTEQIDAGAELAHDFNAKYKPLQAVFWIKESEEKQWNLFLASDQIDDSNFERAYGEVHELLRGKSHVWLDPFQVKVAGINHPIVKSVLDILQRYPAQLPTRLRGRMLGGQFVEDAYIYALPISAPA